MSRRWLVLTSSFPRHDRDLAGHFVRGWARALVESGDRVDVLCWRGPEADSRRVEDGLSVRFVPYAPSRFEQLFFGAGAPENLDDNHWRALLAVPAFAAMLSAVIQHCRRNDYDGIVGHWLVPGGLIARVAGKLTGLPSAVVGHSGGVHLLAGLPPVVSRTLAGWLVDGPTTVPTEPLRQKLTGMVGNQAVERVRVAPMGFEPGPEPPDTKQAQASSAQLRLGFLGRLVPIKGLPVVFEAVQRLRNDGVDVHLDVVGKGPCRQRWASMAPDGVEFRGTAFGTKKWAYLHRWDALVVPSQPRQNGRHEGLPVSLLEGASAGAIPLVSGVPGVKRWLVRPEHQIVDGGRRGWEQALRWVRGGDKELRAETRDAVAPLAWPRYGRWWSKWLDGERQEKNRPAPSLTPGG